MKQSTKGLRIKYKLKSKIKVLYFKDPLRHHPPSI